MAATSRMIELPTPRPSRDEADAKRTRCEAAKAAALDAEVKTLHAKIIKLEGDLSVNASIYEFELEAAETARTKAAEDAQAVAGERDECKKEVARLTNSESRANAMQEQVKIGRRRLNKEQALRELGKVSSIRSR